jgi:hypothetical protein
MLSDGENGAGGLTARAEKGERVSTTKRSADATFAP